MTGKNIVRLSKSSISSKEIKAVQEVLKQEYLGMGKEVELFENDLKSFFLNNKNRVICVNSGTAALHLSLMALDLKKGSEVLIPSITYISSFQAVKSAGLIPIACDVNPFNGSLDLKDLKKRLNKNSKVIMPVHIGGIAHELEEIYNIAKKNNLRIVEDAAHAFGSKYKNRLIGSFGDIVCFSFDGIKNISSGEGGAVITEDIRVAKRIEDTRLLGVERDSKNRYLNKRSWDFECSEIGYRYHMSNIMAAIGRQQLKRFKSFSLKRRSLAIKYVQKMKDLNLIKPLNKNFKNIVPHIFPIIVEGNKRDDLKNFLFENNIETGIHYKPNHLLKLFSDNLPKRPNSEKLFNNLLSLPLHYDLKDSEQSKIIKLLKQFDKEN